ncbi:hypothetical protein HYALB_00007447 [Hymenoscyphus albidus]|uniref:Uncharacterized protein n=2 Tax=Hymenoscyphus TaxID=5182 RepID=A0A9N9KVX6_9HELO|nr:hypothetical protein HYFRA_00010067 [Hymenoscyphus fraxineus]CAG8983319.1 hypothetical protein HYALB_00007447 [Hymenoscyphus albidus]
MCFYDQYRMICNCHKWGHFRQHCSKEYRTGETCGMKLIMNTLEKPEKCKICTKIDTKEGRVRKEQDRINRWVKEEQRGHQRGASIEASQGTIEKLYLEIEELKYQKSQNMASTRKFRWFTTFLYGFAGKMDMGIDGGAGNGSGAWNVIVLLSRSSV